MCLLVCKLIKLGWVIHPWLFKDICFIWSEASAILTNDSLRLNNPIDNCLITPFY